MELYNHTVMLNADRITETDSGSIPTGVLQPVLGTPFDLRVPRHLGEALRALPAIGFDDNYCVSDFGGPQKGANALKFVGA